jgi:hypothetical protein
MFKSWQSLFETIATVILVVVAMFIIKRCDETVKHHNHIITVDSLSILKQLNAKIVVSRDSLGSLVSKKEVMVGDYKRIAEAYKKDFIGKDKELDNLMKRINKNTTNATSFSTEIKFDTTVLIKHDTIQFNDKWINLIATVKNDSSHIKLKIEDEFIANFTEEKHFFKNKNYVYITNINPYSVTKNVESFSQEKHNKRLGVGFQVGYGITATRLSPYVGIGISYQVFQF